MQELNAGGSYPVRILTQAQTIDGSLSHHRQVGALLGGVQECAGSAPAFAGALVHLKVSVPEIIAAVKFINLWNSALLRSVAPNVENFPVDSAFFDT